VRCPLRRRKPSPLTLETLFENRSNHARELAAAFLERELQATVGELSRLWCAQRQAVDPSAGGRRPESLKSLRTRPLFLLREQVPPLLVVGQSPNTFRRFSVIQGGSFEGERLLGEVVSGNDWQSVLADSCIKLDVRLVLRTTDAAFIVMTHQFLRAAPPAVIEKLDKGEEVDPATYYFRMSPMFETSTPKYDRMNRIIAIGTGYRRADGPIYSVFEVL
jgi:hypothetical protein